jgi:hypothetical protein
MTAKDKARELRNKMYLKIPTVYDPTGLAHYPIAKEMALIAVDEIIESQKCCYECKYEGSIELKYWTDVKREIQQL